MTDFSFLDEVQIGGNSTSFLDDVQLEPNLHQTNEKYQVARKIIEDVKPAQQTERQSMDEFVEGLRKKTQTLPVDAPELKADIPDTKISKAQSTAPQIGEGGISSPDRPKESFADVGQERLKQTKQAGSELNKLKNAGIEFARRKIKTSREVESGLESFGIVKHNAFMEGFQDALVRMPEEDRFEAEGALSKAGYVLGNIAEGVLEFGLISKAIPQIPVAQKIPMIGNWVANTLHLGGSFAASQLIDELATKDPDIKRYKERMKASTPLMLALGVAPYISGLRYAVKPEDIKIVQQLVGRGYKFATAGVLAFGESMRQGNSFKDSIIIGIKAGGMVALTTGAKMIPSGTRLSPKTFEDTISTIPIATQIPSKKSASRELIINKRLTEVGGQIEFAAQQGDTKALLKLEKEEAQLIADLQKTQQTALAEAEKEVAVQNEIVDQVTGVTQPDGSILFNLDQGEVKPDVKEGEKKPTEAKPEEIKKKEEVIPTKKEGDKITNIEEAKTYDSDVLNDIRSDIESGEAIKGSLVRDAEGAVIDRISATSTFPAYFQGKGYTKKETLQIIDKKLAGKPLTERQENIIQDLVYSSGFIELKAKAKADAIEVISSLAVKGSVFAKEFNSMTDTEIDDLIKDFDVVGIIDRKEFRNAINEIISEPKEETKKLPDVKTGEEKKEVKVQNKKVFHGTRDTENKPSVKEETKSFNKVLVIGDYQNVLIKQLEAQGIEGAKGLINTQGKVEFNKADQLIKKVFGKKYDAIQYNNVSRPKVGTEYHDLKEDKFYAENKDTAMSYALQSRKAVKTGIKKQAARVISEEERIVNEARTQAFAGQLPQVESEVTPEKKPVEVVKQSKMIKELSNKLNVPVRRGMFRGKAAGIFKHKQKVIRLKAGGIRTIIHEAGHFLQNTNEALDKIIKKNSKALGPLDYEPDKARASEGFAEYLRMKLTDPSNKQLETVKEFDKEFESWLKDNPKIAEVLERTKADWKLWADQPAVAKVQSQISFERDKEGLDIHKTFSSLKTKFSDDMNPVKEFVDLALKKEINLDDDSNPYLLARILKGVSGKAENFLEKGTLNTKLQITGDSLKKVLSPIKDLKMFSTYLTALRSIELSNRRIKTGIDVNDAIKAVQELEKIHPEYKKVQFGLQKYQDSLLKYAAEAGLIDESMLTRVKRMNKAYVPFYRVMEEFDEGGFSGASIAKVSKVVHRIKGSEREIIDPLESIVKNTYTIIGNAEKNMVLLAIEGLSNQDHELGRLFEEVPAPMAKAAEVNPIELLPKEMVDILEEETGLSKEDLGFVSEIFRPSIVNKQGLLTINRNGKKKTFFVEPSLYKALMGMNQEEASIWIKLLSYPAQWLRAGATSLSVEFLQRNSAKDQISAFIYSKTGYLPYVDFARGLFSIIKRNDLYWEFVRSGAMQSTLVSLDNGNIQKKLKDLQGSGRINYKKLINPLAMLQDISELVELSTRLGEFRKLRKKGVSIKQSALTVRDLTNDFRKMGSSIKNVNLIIAFLNANIRGLARPFQASKEDPAGFFTRAMLSLTLPTILLYLINRDDPDYKELPQWRKDAFWNIKIGKRFYPYPRPFQLGVVFAAIPERILQWMDDKDESLLASIAGAVKSGIGLELHALIPTSPKPIIENLTNYSFFRQRHLETASQERLLPEDRFTEYTHESSKLLGKALGISPIKIDNLIKGWTASAGDLFLTMVDKFLLGKKAKLPLRAETTPFIKAFVSKEPIGSASESVRVFFNNLKKSGESFNSLQLIKDKDKRKKFLDKHPEAFAYKQLSTASNSMAILRKQTNRVLMDESLTPKQRLSKVRAMAIRMTEIAKDANDNFKNKLKSETTGAITKETATKKNILKALGQNNLKVTNTKLIRLYIDKYGKDRAIIKAFNTLKEKNLVF